LSSSPSPSASTAAARSRPASATSCTSARARAYASGSRYCPACAQTAGLAHRPDSIAEALEQLPPRLRRIVDGAPATLIVPESIGGPTADELAIATPIVHLLRLARATRSPA
jgi:hypothetical protein